MLPQVKARILNSPSWNIGDGTLVSTQANSARVAMPPKIAVSTHGFDQPVGLPP